jgi:hypothetical protein
MRDLTREISASAKRAIDHNVPLHDVIQGEILNTMVEFQDKKFEDVAWSQGYQDALADIYRLCYDVIFYNQDRLTPRS